MHDESLMHGVSGDMSTCLAFKHVLLNLIYIHGSLFQALN